MKVPGMSACCAVLLWLQMGSVTVDETFTFQKSKNKNSTFLDKAHMNCSQDSRIIV